MILNIFKCENDKEFIFCGVVNGYLMMFSNLRVINVFLIYNSFNV